MKRNIILALLITLTIFFAGCAQKIEETVEEKTLQEDQKEELLVGETVYPLELTDSLGRTVVIDKEPMRIVSVAPNITETIYALGAEEKLVGRTDYCDYPEKVAELASIGLLSEPNQEVITELNPDIIIGSTHFKEDVITNLETLGYTVVVLYGENSFDGVYKTINALGKVLNVQENSVELQSSMKERVSMIASKLENVEKPSVYYVVAYGESGDFTATGETFIAEMLELAGGDNIAQEGSGWRFSYERIVEKDPDLIICSKHNDAKEGFTTNENYQLLSAVAEGNVYEIDNNLLDRQGPRLVEGLEALAKIIHPERFE